MLVTVLRLILGFVEFEASGGFAERFLNLCTINGITLWNVINDGVKVKACTDIKSYKTIRKSARNSGMKIKIVKKRGLPFFLKNNKARVGVLVGALLATAFLGFSSCIIWDVEISGNNYLKQDVLFESLTENGLRVGAFKSNIDTAVLEKNLLKEYPELSWVSVNIFGTKAVLEVKENIRKPDIIDSKTPTNVIAGKDGQIVLVQGYNGTNMVKEGDVVVKGELLISGITLMTDGSEKLVHSFGKVLASTITELKSESCIVKKESVLKNVRVKYQIHVLGVDIPLFVKCKGEELYRGKKRLSGNEITLPFGVSWIVLCEAEEREITLSEKQAVLVGLKKCVEEKRENFKGEEKIKKIKYNKEILGGNIVFNCKVSAEENIAVEKEIFTE